ncbi:MAG TPA: hypothetical protein VEI03_02295 [Stellaceae bacterium]|nr:hypothetical protein [Stellaceae bacterium]
MSIQGIALIVAGIILIVLAWRKSRTRSFIGNYIRGDATGTTTMTTSVTHAGSRPSSSDPISWVIGIIGVAVALFGIYLDHPDMFSR